MSAQTAVALLLALASTTLTNVAYLREHDAAAALPALSLRRPLHSVQALLTDRSWLVGFALESCGFALYVAALAGYAVGTAFLQLGYQKGGALTVAGLATLLTNALPIAAGSVVLGEPVPSGALGGVRILAFAAV